MSARRLGDWLADQITRWVATWLSIGLHTVWFALWLALSLGIALLTNAVSLEAIYLCLLILNAQARAEQRDRDRNVEQKREVDEIHAMQRAEIATLGQIVRDLRETVDTLRQQRE